MAKKGGEYLIEMIPVIPNSAENKALSKFQKISKKMGGSLKSAMKVGAASLVGFMAVAASKANKQLANLRGATEETAARLDRVQTVADNIGIGKKSGKLDIFGRALQVKGVNFDELADIISKFQTRVGAGELAEFDFKGATTFDKFLNAFQFVQGQEDSDKKAALAQRLFEEEGVIKLQEALQTSPEQFKQIIKELGLGVTEKSVKARSAAVARGADFEQKLGIRKTRQEIEKEATIDKFIGKNEKELLAISTAEQAEANKELANIGGNIKSLLEADKAQKKATQLVTDLANEALNAIVNIMIPVLNGIKEVLNKIRKWFG